MQKETAMRKGLVAGDQLEMLSMRAKVRAQKYEGSTVASENIRRAPVAESEAGVVTTTGFRDC